MKYFIIYIFVPVLLIVTGLLSLPFTSDFIKKNFPDLTFYLAIFVIVGSVVNYFFVQLRLFLEQERLIKKMQMTTPIAREMDAFCKLYSAYEVSAHLFIPKKLFFQRIEPEQNNSQKKKFSWSCKVLSPEWQSGTHIHNKLKMTSQQGFIGASYEAGPLTAVRFGVLNNNNQTLPNFNFSNDQQRLLQGIVFVASCAIPNVNKSREAIGVVSIDSYKLGSEILINDTAQLKQMINRLENLAIVLGDHLKDYES